MRRLARFRGRAAGMAARAEQLGRVEQRTARIALVAARVSGMAFGAFAVHVTVGKEHPALRAVQLRGRMLRDEAVLVQVGEHRLRDFGALVVGGAPEFVERDAEPVVDFLVNGIVMVAQLARRFLLFFRPCLGRRAVLVRAADIQRLIAAAAAEPREHIRAEHLNEIPQMRDIVDIR